MGAGHRTIAVPIRRHRRAAQTALGFEQPKPTGDGDSCRNQRHRDCDCDEHANCAWNGHALEVGQPGKAQTEDRAGDRQTGRQHDRGDTAIRGVEGRFAVLAGLTCLLVPTEEKYPVVGSGRDARDTSILTANVESTRTIGDGRGTQRFRGQPLIRRQP